MGVRQMEGEEKEREGEGGVKGVGVINTVEPTLSGPGPGPGPGPHADIFPSSTTTVTTTMSSNAR